MNATQMGDWFAGVFVAMPGIATVAVRHVDPETGSTLATATGVRAYKKGSSPDAVERLEAAAVKTRTCQWRLVAADLGFEPEPYSVIVEEDGTLWWILSVASEVFGTYRVCQCSEHPEV